MKHVCRTRLHAIVLMFKAMPIQLSQTRGQKSFLNSIASFVRSLLNVNGPHVRVNQTCRCIILTWMIFYYPTRANVNTCPIPEDCIIQGHAQSRDMHKRVFHLCTPLLCTGKLGGGRIRMLHRQSATYGKETVCWWHQLTNCAFDFGECDWTLT